MTLSFCGSPVGYRGIVVEFDGKSRQNDQRNGRILISRQEISFC